MFGLIGKLYTKRGPSLPAALPPDNTLRYYLTYNVNGRNHTMTVRADGDVTPTAASEDISAFIEAMAGVLYASTFVKFEYSAEGSSVRVPAAWGGITEWGSGESVPNAPSAWSFTGKSVDGHKFTLQLFGRNSAPTDDWRVPAVDSSNISDAIDALQTTDAIFLSISGAQPIYNPYANQSMNAYWQRKARVS